MVKIKPFKGIRYNQGENNSMEKLVSQPYDRIRYGLRKKYYELSEYNIARIIKNKEEETDNEQENVYSRAQALYNKWLAEGVLKQEEKPAIYVYNQTFKVNGRLHTRKGFICTIELTSFDEGIILPHEKTLPGPKMDRYNLMKATEANFGLIFLLYSDPISYINSLLDIAISNLEPDVDVTEYNETDVRQQMWVITNPEVISIVQSHMASKKGLIIADGHHRYETALIYRDEMREKYPDKKGAGFNYRMVHMVSMEDPELIILPTHREVFGFEGLSQDDVIKDVSSCFHLIPFSEKEDFFAAMTKNALKYPIGFYSGGNFCMLVIRSINFLDGIESIEEAAWASLDGSLVDCVLLDKILGFHEQVIDAETNIRYHRDPELAIANVDSQKGKFIIFLNPTPIEVVKSKVSQGKVMPAKTTDFYPKAISGLVIFSHNDEL
jgi:uncharacterized protein (DUF1015 family)